MCFNSGVMVYSPSVDDMNGIFALVANSPEGTWLSMCTGEPRVDGDQELIFFYFQGQRRLEALPPCTLEPHLLYSNV
jgi:hypothetical protein